MIRLQTPTPGPSELLVRLSVTGICGTDLGLASGKLGPTKDILGHEGVGYVAQIGSASGSLAQLGDRVAITWVRDICGVCQYCLHPGGEVRCKEQLNSGRRLDGTFAEYALVPARYVVHLPEHIMVSDEMIAPILCAGVTAYTALKSSGGVGGQWIAVSGSGGGVGALTIKYAKAMGFRVVAIDVGDAKRRISMECGADHFIDANSSTSLVEQVDGVTMQRGTSIVLVCAGSGEAYNAVLDIVAPYGTLVCVGIPPPDHLVSFHPLLLIDRGFKIIGSAVGTRQDLMEAIDFVQAGLVKPTIIVERFTDLPDLLSDFANVSDDDLY
ncbi:hypothetical protein NW762_012482 [Fusarium torreyae]|uniref:alcohol dehydrogenase n=1 Tax=Fusarium torreyae TaxID=1237075 RepID=A0A9W8RRA1_9HYPO|nr:hypothetical protein NW762_012482 [Fusarium torreyae]